MARQVGLKRLGFALYKGASAGVPTWDSIEMINQAVEVSTTNVYSEYSFYSNDVVEESEKILSSVEVNITLGYVTNELKAKYLGAVRSAASGLTTTGSSAVNTPSLAIVYEISKSNGESDYKVLYNCKLALDEATNRTKEDEIEGVEVTLTGVALPCPITNDVIGEISTDDQGTEIVAETQKAMLDAFFEAVQVRA